MPESMTLAEIARTRVQLRDTLREAQGEYRRAVEREQRARVTIDALARERLRDENKGREAVLDAQVNVAQERAEQAREEVRRRNSALAEAQTRLAALEGEHESAYAKAKAEAEEAAAKLEAIDREIAGLQAQIEKAKRVTLDDDVDPEAKVNDLCKRVADLKNTRAKSEKVVSSAVARRDAARLEEVKALRDEWHLALTHMLEREAAACAILVEIGRMVAPHIVRYLDVKGEANAAGEDFNLLAEQFKALDLPESEIGRARDKLLRSHSLWTPDDPPPDDRYWRWEPPPGDSLTDAAFRAGLAALRWFSPPDLDACVLPDMPLREAFLSWGRSGEWPKAEPEPKPEPPPEAKAEPAKPEDKKPLPTLVSVTGENGTERMVRVTHKGAPAPEESDANAE